MSSEKGGCFSLTPSVHFQLENGLKVVFLPMQRTDVLAIQVWVKTGSIYEGKFLGSGISHFVEHMVFKGTQKRSYEDIFQETQRQGAKLNAYTSFDRTVYTYDGATESLGVGLDILSDMLCRSTFPAEELSKERDVILREIDMCNDDPDDRLSQILFETAFHQHPYQYPIIGLRPIFEKLTREDLLEYWGKRYAVNNMTLIIAGNLRADQVKEQTQKYFGGFSPKCLAPVYIPEEPFQLAERFQHEYGSYQLTRGAIAFKIPGIGHKDGAKLQVLASVLGSGGSSLLYQKLREELHWVYSIDVSSWMADGLGLFWIQYTCSPERQKQVEDFLQHHLCELIENNLSENAVKKAYNQAIVSELDARKTVSGCAHHVGWATVCLGDEHYPKHYLEQLETLIASAVKSVGKKYFRKVACTTVSLGPQLEASEEPVEHFPLKGNDVEEFTVEGVRVLIQRNEDFPKTHVQALFSAGSLYEPQDKRGITQLLATLLTKDTQQQTSVKIAETIESIGGQFNGFSGNNHLGISLEVLSKDVKVALPLLKNALTTPAFLQKTFDTEKNAQLAELKEMQDDVFFVGFQKIRYQFFQKHPYNIGQLGTEESIKNITLEDCVAFYKKLIVKHNCVLSVVTSLPQETILKYLTPICAELNSETSFNLKSDTIDFSPVIQKTETLDKEQAMVFRAYPIAGMSDEDFYVGEFLEELFNGLSSSFVEEVREKRGLAYTVGATRLLGKKEGMFCLFAGTQAQQVPAVEAEMEKGIQRVLDKKVTESEFEICRTCLKVNHQLRLQTLSRKAFQAGYNNLLQLPTQHWLEYEQKIDTITLEQFYNVCEKYLKSGRSSTLTLLPK